MTTSTLVDAVRALSPVIGESLELTESERSLPDSIVHALIDVGVFKLFVPRALSGTETNPATVSANCLMLDDLPLQHSTTSQTPRSAGLSRGLVASALAR